MYAEETESAAATKEWMSPATPPRRMVSVSTPPPPYMPKDMSVSGMDYCRESYDAHRRHVVESPLIYVGVTMHRQADCPSCMSLFLFERSYLVVGNIQQDLMQRITTWAWATKFPPKIGSYDFRSSFGPLYSTSLLQLVPGDVIISINGRSITSLDVDAYLSKETRLDILAVRSETARYEAHSILSRDVPNRDYHVAQAAFRSMGSLIRTISNPCQRRLFTQPPHESNGTWKYDRQHAPVKIPNVTSHKKTAAKGGHFSVTQHAVKRAFMPVQPASKVDSTVCDAEKFLFRTKEGNPHVVRNELSPLDPGDRTQLFLSPIEATSFSTWLTKRKVTWREMRAKRKMILENSGQCDGITGLPLNNVPGKEAQIYAWLQVRKDQWRSDRAKRRRCNESVPGMMIETQASPSRTSPPQQPLVYLGFKLHRESVKESWGLHVTFLDKWFLGVGHVRDVAPSRSQQWAWATSSPISGAFLTAGHEDVQNFFEMQPLHSSCFLHLQPGDMILSLDGKPISSFKSMADITTFLKQATTLSIIAIRHEDASQIAQAAWNQGTDAMDIRDRSLYVSDVAFRCMIPLVHDTPGLVNVLFPNSSQKTAFYRSYVSSVMPVSSLHSAPPSGARCGLLPYTGVSSPFAAIPRVEKEPRNRLFRDDKGHPLLYEDDLEFDLEEGNRACNFLPTLSTQSFPSWLENRKTTWRKKWKVHSIQLDTDSDYDSDDSSPSISADFWSRQGHPNFQNWLAASTFRWKQSYTWNKRKRERLEKEYEEVVHFPSSTAADQMQTWLRVRKHQWRFLRRKRQRRLQDEGKATSSPALTEQGGREVCLESPSTNSPSPSETSLDDMSDSKCAASEVYSAPRSIAVPRQTFGEMKIIDALLEEQERRRKALQERPPIDIRFLFDAKLGAPDDVVGHCLKFLHRSEHGKLLCVSSATRKAMKDRDEMWRQLCRLNKHWILPRRPRKRWHELYITKIRQDEEMSRKLSDDILNKAAAILFKGDHLLKIEKLVEEGERRFNFDINYVSGVVCERNGLLNLAVIHSRPKVVRWLIETKGADIETYDRGSFTPLLNAAWAGDRYLVRFLLSQGCDRTKVGTGHFFEPLAVKFEGLNAEGWARRKGHHDLANLISLGL